jgi:transcriptional regulator with XRE-family HTH domain
MIRTDPLLQQLGPRLRDARQTANLTVREVGERLGVDHSMIVRYENGESLPPLDRVIALADLYGLTPAALLARHAAAITIIATIDQAEAGAIARLGALLRDELRYPPSSLRLLTFIPHPSFGGLLVSRE